MNQELVKTSKFISLVLRHAPERIGLTLDNEGWADVDELISKSGKKLNLETLKKVVAENNKKRFTFSDDEKKIRANQGHSIKINLGIVSRQPPSMLYHGTAGHFISSIREKGLLKMKRNHVHLTDGITTAIITGKRKGKPIVLFIEYRKMYENNYKFYLSKNLVWLTDHVPTEFIQQFNKKDPKNDSFRNKK